MALFILDKKIEKPQVPSSDSAMNINVLFVSIKHDNIVCVMKGK